MYSVTDDAGVREARGSMPSCLHFFAAKGAPPNAMAATMAAHQDMGPIAFKGQVARESWRSSWSGYYAKRWNRLLGVQFVLDKNKARDSGEGSMRQFRNEFLKVRGVLVWYCIAAGM